ncbi:uncharacterized protein LOC124690959, partial [Lolium rigidum]|uniref:uncharacterized protein LOC124690959 n=1 Tax=Lolium rigidum TaxID=89674 RepID=UPI001F5CC65E
PPHTHLLPTVVTPPPAPRSSTGLPAADAMPALLRPAVLPVCAVTSGGGSGGNDKWAPRQQRSWWGRSKQSLPHQPGGSGGGPLDQVLGVLRRDGEFLQAAAAGGQLRDALWLRFLEKKKKQHQRGKQPKPKPVNEEEAPAPAPRAAAFPAYPPGLSCVELAMADLQALKVYADSSRKEFVLRFLGSKQQQQQQPQSQQQSAKPKPVFQKQLKPKKPKPDEQQKQQQALQAPAFPPHSYPPGMSCMELMMADLEALKLYVNYFLAILTTPLPQHYDPDLLAQYFVSRPHILVFRMVEVSYNCPPCLLLPRFTCFSSSI